MSQVLFRGQGVYVTVERSWRDMGREAEYAIVGGQRVRVSEASKPYPEIFQIGDTFVYGDLKPLDNDKDIGPHVPEPWATKMREFIQKTKQEPVEVPVYEDPREAREALVAPVKKGRGRPPKQETVNRRIEIKDEESLIAVGGVAI